MATKAMTFRCQRCGLSLYPHESLVDLKPAQLNLISNASANSLDVYEGSHGKTESWSLQDGSKPPWGLSQIPESQRSLFMGKSGAMGSFVVLSDSMIGPPHTSTPEFSKNAPADADDISSQPHASDFSSRLNKLENLFEIISSQTEIDFPVCVDCESALVDGFKQKFVESCQERDSYIDFLNNLKAESEPSEKEVTQLQLDIKNLELENEECLSNLKLAEDEKRQIEKELEDLQKEIDALDQEEGDFYKARNEFDLEMAELHDEKDRVESIYEKESNQLEKLQKVNVYNDVFCIGFDGYFGTINGLRLGRLKDIKVEWSEINAAWGQVLLLLATVTNKIGFKIKGYRLRPLGSTSRIEKLELDERTGEYVKVASLELFSSGDYPLERILNHKRLDAAMLAFLAVLKQICDHIESTDDSLHAPHVIADDKIGGISIKLSMSTSNENWTTACKFALAS